MNTLDLALGIAFKFIFTAKFWLALGATLGILEMFSGTFYALAFCVAALAMAGGISLWPGLLTQWYQVMLAYSVMALAMSLLVYRLNQQSLAGQRPDINEDLSS